MQRILQIDSIFQSLKVDTIQNFFNITNFNDEQTFNDNIIQSNQTQVHDVYGDLLLSNDNSQNYVTVRSNLNVNNKITVSEEFEMGNQSSTVINKLYGNIEIGTVGKMSEFFGDVLFNGNVFFGNNISSDNITVNDTFEITNQTGDHSLEGNYVISNGSGTVLVNGQTEIDNILEVNDDQTFNQSITVDGVQNIQNGNFTTLVMDNGDLNSTNSNVNGDWIINQELKMNSYPKMIGQHHQQQNVQQFGQIQDGVNDDTIQIQEQINSIEQKGGGIVYFPDTTDQYVISDSLKISDNILLIGDNLKGLKRSRIKPTNGQPRETITQSYESNTDETGETPSGDIDSSNMTYTIQNTPIIPGSVSIVVDGGQAITDTDDGDGTGTLSDGGDIDYQTGIFTLIVQPVTSIQQDYSYIQTITDLSPSTGSINSTNTSFSFSTLPINQNSFELSIDDRPLITDDGSGDLSDDFGTIDYQTGDLSLNGYSGVMIQNSVQGELQHFQGVTGLFLDGSNTTNTQIDLNLKDGIIDNLTIHNCWTYGISIGGVGILQDQLQLNNTITNNYLQGYDTTQFWDGIFIDYYSQDFLIKNNYIENVQNQNIHLRSWNNKIESNHLYNSDKYGIELEQTTENIISNNYIENIGQYGIFLNDKSPTETTINTIISTNIFRNINNLDEVVNSQVIYGEGQNLSILNITNNIVKRDSVSEPTIDYFFYSDESIPDIEHFLGMNAYKSDLIDSLKNF